MDTQKINSLLQNRWVLGAVIGLGSLLLVINYYLLLIQFLPQTIAYSYGKAESCVISPELLPSLHKPQGTTPFRISQQGIVKVGGLSLFSSKLCAEAKSTPASTSAYTEQIALKRIRIVTARYPELASKLPKPQSLSLSRPLELHLKQADTTFRYAVTVGNALSPCTTSATTLNCKLGALKLNYGQKYTASIVRTFHGRPAGTVLTQSVTTISATGITATSIAANAVVQDSPQTFTLTTNKPITKLGNLTASSKNADGTTSAVAVSAKFSGQTITATFTKPLPRKATVSLHIDSIVATDSSGLEVPYTVSFATSGGPKEVGFSAASYDTLTNQSLQLTFDQALNSTQDPNTYTTLLVNGTRQASSITASGTKLLVAAPAGGFPVCASVSIQLTTAAQNAYGISGDSGGSYTTRVRCYTTFSIGTSVKGRPMTAYKFGSGPTMILYIAAMHGDESNTAVLMQKWITDINSNPSLVATNHTLVVIPQINPDGVAANTRLNAHGIDLNRNFPSNNWQTNVTEPGGAMTTDGGPTPLSEPESLALANYIAASKPRLVLTYHSHAGIVEANDAGDSIKLAALYAARTGYQAIPTYAIGNTFDYSTGGAMEDWMNDKLNLPAFVIELTSATNDEFAKNQAAMRAMALE